MQRISNWQELMQMKTTTDKISSYVKYDDGSVDEFFIFKDDTKPIVKSVQQEIYDHITLINITPLTCNSGNNVIVTKKSESIDTYFITYKDMILTVKAQDALEASSIYEIFNENTIIPDNSYNLSQSETSHALKMIAKSITKLNLPIDSIKWLDPVLGYPNMSVHRNFKHNFTINYIKTCPNSINTIDADILEHHIDFDNSSELTYLKITATTIISDIIDVRNIGTDNRIMKIDWFISNKSSMERYFYSSNMKRIIPITIQLLTYPT